MSLTVILCLVSLLVSSMALGFVYFVSRKDVARRIVITALTLVVSLHLLYLNNKALVGEQTLHANIVSAEAGQIVVEFADVADRVQVLTKPQEGLVRPELVEEVLRRLTLPDEKGQPRTKVTRERIDVQGTRLTVLLDPPVPDEVDKWLTRHAYHLDNPSKALLHQNLGIDLRGGVEFACRLYKNGEVVSADDEIVAILRRRLDERGLTEPQVFRLTSGDLQVVIPGGTEADAARTRRVLETTGNLEVRRVVYTIGDPNLVTDEGNGVHGFAPTYRNPLMDPFDDIVYANAERDDPQEPAYYHLGPVAWDGSRIDKAYRTVDRNGNPAVSIELNAEGGELNAKFTEMLLAEGQGGQKKGEPGQAGTTRLFGHLAISMDGLVVSAPVVLGASSNQTQITGGGQGFEIDEAQRLVDVLNAGALRVKPRVISERVVGPSLGAETIAQGSRAMLIGFALVVAAMLGCYWFKLGLVANISLAITVSLVFVVLSVFNATLTLPGLAGLVLTVGMAVDANILIFERLREEMREDIDVATGIANGYGRAFTTILDANLTTFITAFVLYVVGTGPIKGFGLTLMIGILTSMFGALYVGRAATDWFYRKAEQVRIPQVVPAIKLPYTRFRFIAMAMSLVVAIGSWYTFITGVPSTDDRFGIDFTGGYQLQVNFREDFTAEQLRERLAKAHAEGGEAAALLDPKALQLQAYYGGFEHTGTASRQWVLKGRDVEGARLERQRADLENRQSRVNRALEEQKQLQLRGDDAYDPVQRKEYEAELAALEEEIIVLTAQLDARQNDFQEQLSEAFDEVLPEVGSEIVAAGWRDQTLDLTIAVIQDIGKEKLRLIERALEEPNEVTDVELALAAVGDQHHLTVRTTFAKPPAPLDAIDRASARITRLGALLGVTPDDPLAVGRLDKTSTTLAAIGEALAGHNVSFDEPFPSSQHFSPLVGDQMWRAAMWAMAISMLAILAYVAARFEFRYGIGAIIALIHDVVITIALLAVFNIQIDLTVIAALLTIIGYSLNDTIIVFDRIRENVRSMERPLAEIIDSSIATTMSRTTLTSATTMLVVVVLVLIGGEGLAAFSGTLLIGLVLGTYSSIFIAAPVLLMLNKGRPASALIAAATLQEVDQDDVGKDGYGEAPEPAPAT